jgi:predicted ribosome quality control (RQC) complex YloA/Tae2 family protein
MKIHISNSIIYRIGQNAKENTQLINESQKDWIWFHLESFPSCHVVVCQPEADAAIIFTAANLVKEHSKYKFKNIGVNYCKINNLRQGMKDGSVTFVSRRQVKKINC